MEYKGQHHQQPVPCLCVVCVWCVPIAPSTSRHSFPVAGVWSFLTQHFGVPSGTPGTDTNTHTHGGTTTISLQCVGARAPFLCQTTFWVDAVLGYFCVWHVRAWMVRCMWPMLGPIRSQRKVCSRCNELFDIVVLVARCGTRHRHKSALGLVVGRWVFLYRSDSCNFCRHLAAVHKY